MALIDVKQIVFSGSMFIHSEGHFWGGRWPQLGNEYVIKDYVDSLFSGSSAGSGSFYSLTDTPSVGYQGRILFEGSSPSTVQDSENFKWDSGYFYLDSGILHLSSVGLSFQNLSKDETEMGYFSRSLTLNEINTQNIPPAYQSLIELKSKHQDPANGVEEEVILFSRFVE